MSTTTGRPGAVRLVPAVVQATKILRTISKAQQGLSVTVVSRETGISQSTCFNLLRTLAQEGILNFDAESKTYTLGLGLLEIAGGVQNLTRPEIIRPELLRVAGAHDALVTLWEIIDNERMVLLDRVAASRAVRIEVRLGQRLPALSGAVGRCVAAHLGLSAKQLRKQFDAMIWENAPSFESFVADMQQSKTDGFAIDCGNWLKGINAVGAVVLDSRGAPRMGIGALTLFGQLDVNALRRLGQDMHDLRSLIERTIFSASDLLS
jgi:DNA-binding IclR family transcriptional regulator